PFVLEHVIKEMVIAAGVLPVNLVVSAHDRARLRSLYGDLEGQQVRFSVCIRVDDRVKPMAVCFVAIEREVLEVRAPTPPLDAVYLLGCHDGAMVRVFPKIFECTPIARVACEVDPAGKLNVESTDSRFAGDRHALLSYEIWVKTS